MSNTSVTIQEDCEGICKLDSSRFCFESRMDANSIISEVGVDAYPRSMMWLDIISNVVASILFVCEWLIDIIWQLILIEDGLSIITIPYNLVSEDMLDSKTVRNNIITIDGDTMSDRIMTAHHLSFDVMIRTPQPCVINDHVAGVDGDHVVRSHLVMPLVSGPTDSCKDIAGNTWILRRSLELSISATPL